MSYAYVADPSAILRGGAALIPDLAAQLAQSRQLDIQEQQANTASLGLQRQLSEDQRERMEEQAYTADLQALSALPTKDQPQALIALMRKYPKRSEAVKRSYDSQDETVKAADFKAAAEVYSFVQNGAPDKAAALIRKRIAADKAAGLDTADDEEIALALESGDPAKVQEAAAQIGWQLSTAAGPEKFASTYGAITPDPTALQQNYAWIKDGLGRDEQAEAYLSGNTDQIVSIPLPGGRQYLGPRSGLSSLQQSGESGGAAAAVPRVNGGAPGADRGTRNNNPGNLKDGPFARRQPGYQGADSGGFAVFASPSHGQKAQETLLTGNYLSKGHDTPRKIIGRYAPAGENSSASMTNYAAYVARRLGIGIDDKVPSGKAGLLAQAMREFETGQTVKAAPAKGPVRVTSKAQFDKLPSGTVFIAPDGSQRRKP